MLASPYILSMMLFSGVTRIKALVSWWIFVNLELFVSICSQA